MWFFLFIAILFLEVSRTEFGKAKFEYEKIFEYHMIPATESDYTFDGLNGDAKDKAIVIFIGEVVISITLGVFVAYPIWTLNFENLNGFIWATLALIISVAGLYCSWVNVELNNNPGRFYKLNPLAMYKWFRYTLYGICIVFAIYLVVTHYVTLLTPEPASTFDRIDQPSMQIK